MNFTECRVYTHLQPTESLALIIKSWKLEKTENNWVSKWKHINKGKIPFWSMFLVNWILKIYQLRHFINNNIEIVFVSVCSWIDVSVRAYCSMTWDHRQDNWIDVNKTWTKDEECLNKYCIPVFFAVTTAVTLFSWFSKLVHENNDREIYELELE